MAKARVTLNTTESYSSRGYDFKKGGARVITNAGDIRYFQCNPAFTVTVLEGSVKKALPPPIPEDDDESESEEDEEDEERANAGTFTRTDLESMTKASLMELVDGDDAVTAKIDPTMKKSKMIDVILGVSS